MKKLLIVLAVLLVASSAFAARTMSIDTRYAESVDRNMVLIKLSCVAHTDGTFASADIDDNRPDPYWSKGYKLLDAWVVNDATTYPAAGAVTIVDTTTRQLVGTTAGDTLTLSTSASGVAYLAIDRGSGQRAVTSKLSISTTTTTTNGSIFTVYLLLGR
jgi:hypothetical protein